MTDHVYLDNAATTFPKPPEVIQFMCEFYTTRGVNPGRTGFDLALELVRERWGKRMVDKGATSCFEEWSDVGSWRAGTFRGFIRTHSHAWSACPAEFLIRNLMGLEIVEPGCQKIRLNPRKIEFDYSVQYPTPRGDIRVESRKDKVEFSVPDGIQVVTD